MPATLDGMAEQLRALTITVNELKGLIRDEIKDLKTEQIAQLQKENERLADDQRRAWDAIRALEKRDAERKGGFRVVHGIIGFFSATIGGGIGALIHKLLG